jgi:hypothetical protein
MKISSATIKTFLLCTVLVTLVAPAPAFAYLDPGTGSVILQVLVAGLLGALFTIKTMWRNIKGFFGRMTGKSSTDSHDVG